MIGLHSDFASVMIRETMTAVEPFEDWSRVRSPSRAARRLKQGHRQNIVHRYKPAAFQINGVIYAHPEIVRELRANSALENSKASLADATNNPVPLTLSDAGSDAEGRS